MLGTLGLSSAQDLKNTRNTHNGVCGALNLEFPLQTTCLHDTLEKCGVFCLLLCHSLFVPPHKIPSAILQTAGNTLNNISTCSKTSWTSGLKDKCSKASRCCGLSGHSIRENIIDVCMGTSHRHMLSNSFEASVISIRL